MSQQYIRKDSALYLYPEVEEPKYLYPGDISSVVKYSREQKAYNKWKESRIEMSPELKAVTKEGDVLTEGKEFIITGGQRKRNHDGTTTRTEKLAIPIKQTKEAGEDDVASQEQPSACVVSLTASSGNSIEQEFQGSQIKIVQEYLDFHGISFLHKSVLSRLEDFALWVVRNHIDLPKPDPTERVNRVEVIDEKGRSYVNWKDGIKVHLDYQDGGKTLKVFVRSFQPK